MENLQNILAAATLVFGIFCFIAPRQVAKLVGWTIEDLKGLIEIRAVYGGFLVGMSAAALLLDTQEAFIVLGGGWLSAGVARFLSLALAKEPIKLNYTSIAMVFEIVMGVLLILA